MKFRPFSIPRKQPKMNDMLYPKGSKQPSNVWMGTIVMNVPQTSSGPAVSPTPTPSVTPTMTVTPTISLTPTITPSPTISLTPTQTPTPTISVTPTITPTQTVTPTISLTPSITPTQSALPSGTTEANAYLTAVVNAGGTGIDSTVSAATRTLFTSLVSNGLWDKMTGFYPLLGGTSASVKFNGKNPIDTDGAYRLTLNGGWTYTSSGMTGNYSNTYADTHISGTTLNRYSYHHSYYSLTQTSNSFEQDMGARNGSGGLGTYSEFTANYIAFGGNYRQYNVNSIGLATDSASANSGTTGYFIASRTSDSTTYLWKNGSYNLSGTTATNGTIPFSIYIGATNDNGTAADPNSKAVGFASVGQGLTPSEMTTLSSIVNTWATSISRNTY